MIKNNHTDLTPKTRTNNSTLKNSPLIKTYSRKGGRGINEHKTGLLENYLPTITIPKDKTNLTLEKDFKGKTGIWFEIGFGNGEHLVQQAQQHPDKELIGCEVYLRSFTTCLKSVYDRKIENIKLYNDDARDLLNNFADAQIERIFLLFPDPWPKKRHIKRRMINTENLDIFARTLKKGGIFRVATDHPVYMEHTIEMMALDTRFKATFKVVEDIIVEPADHVKTKYQIKNMASSKQPFFMDFVRV